MRKPIAVLAFSGGLDTSFCVPWLKEHSYDVVTVTVNTGGFTPADLSQIAARAEELNPRWRIGQSQNGLGYASQGGVG